MTEETDATGAAGYVTSWLDYIAGSTPATTEQPTSTRFVIAAVLADETIVKIDENARWYPTARVYRSTSTKVELTEAMRGDDSVFTNDSGVYRVLTPEQYTDIKRDEAARAEAVAAAAVSSPRVTRAQTPTPTPTPTPTRLLPSPPRVAMERLSIAPTSAPTVCDAHSRVRTLVAVGPSHIAAALRHATPIMERARKANNEVVVVIVGAADEQEAEAALRVPGDRILLAGGGELATLTLGRGATGPMRSYLREALLLETVAGTAGGVDLKEGGGGGGGGAWLLPASPVPLDGARAPLAPRAGASMRDWKDALNAQWCEWRRRYLEGEAELSADDKALLAVYTSLPRAPRPEDPPLASFARDAIGIVGLAAPPPTGVVDHTLVWRGVQRDGRGWPEPLARWASPGGGPSSVYSAVCTWCDKVRTHLDQAAPRLDLHANASELQWEVEQTVLSLLTYTAGDFSQPFFKRFDDLRGVLGPVVLAGRAGAQSMRTVWWTLPDRAGGALMLMPEPYVQLTTKGHHAHTPPAHGGPMLAAQGFLVLADADALPMTLSGVRPEELEPERRALGRRLWIPNGATAAESQAAVEELRVVKPVDDPLATFCTTTTTTQRDVEAAQAVQAVAELTPGARVAGTPGRTVWFTRATSSDALHGLRVRLTKRATPPYMPTLDVDDFEGGMQTPFESFW